MHLVYLFIRYANFSDDGLQPSYFARNRAELVQDSLMIRVSKPVMRKAASIVLTDVDDAEDEFGRRKSRAQESTEQDTPYVAPHHHTLCFCVCSTCILLH